MITPEYIIIGIISLIWPISAFSIGILMLLKYKKYKYRPYLYWGLGWLIISKSWWPQTINFIFSTQLDANLTVLIGLSLEPAAIILYILALSYVMFKKKFKTIALILIIYAIFFNLVLWILYFTDQNPGNLYLNNIVEVKGIFDYDVIGLYLILALIDLMLYIMFGILIFFKGHKTEDKEAKIKSNFFLITTFLFVIGAILDQIFFTIITVMISRMLLILNIIFLYIYVVWPDRVKKIFLKK